MHGFPSGSKWWCLTHLDVDYLFRLLLNLNTILTLCSKKYSTAKYEVIWKDIFGNFVNYLLTISNYGCKCIDQILLKHTAIPMRVTQCNTAVNIHVILFIMLTSHCDPLFVDVQKQNESSNQRLYSFYIYTYYFTLNLLLSIALWTRSRSFLATTVKVISIPADRQNVSQFHYITNDITRGPVSAPLRPTCGYLQRHAPHQILRWTSCG